MEKFPEKIGKARMLAIEGSYDESILYYQQAISLIQLSIDYLQPIEKPSMLQALKYIQDEHQNIQLLKKEIDVWKHPFPKPPTNNPYENLSPPPSYSAVVSSPSNKKYSNNGKATFQHQAHHVSHGQRSYAYVEPKHNDQVPNIKWEIRTPQKKYELDNKITVSSPQKDPDVWPPPSPDPVSRRKPLIDSSSTRQSQFYNNTNVRRETASSSAKNTRVKNSNISSKRHESEKGSPSVNQNSRKGVISKEKPNDKKIPPQPSTGPQGKKKYSDLAREESWVDLELIDSVERDILDVSAPIRFEDIAGLHDAKRVLQEAVMLPLLAPHLFTGRIKASKGVLMFGPPGTGKTLLAKAVAHECGTTFFNVSASTLSSKFRGDSEKMVRILFDMARYYAPSTIFMDEIDSIAGSRGGAQEHEASRRVKTELLVQVNGVSSGTEDESRVVLLAATNMPWDLDEAMRRRLDKRVYIPLPDEEGRRELFRMNLQDSKKIKLAENIDLEILVKSTEGYSGHDIHSVCTAAAMMPIRRIYTPEYLKELKNKGSDVPEDEVLIVTQDDLMTALRDVCKSVGGAELERYKQWEDEFGSK